MSTKTDITINSIDANNKKVTNKISYVNPNITNQQALTLAQTIAALTTDSYQSTTKTDTTEISAKPLFALYSCSVGFNNTNYVSSGTRPDLANDQVVNYPVANVTSGIYVQLVAAAFDMSNLKPLVESDYPLATVTFNQTYKSWVFRYDLGETPTVGQSFQFNITIPETDTSAATSFKFTVNIVNEEG